MGRKGAELSPDVKTVITQLYEDGSSITRISKLLDIPRTTVSSFIHRFLQRGTVENMERKGRPKLVTPRDYRKLERIVKTNRRDTLADITTKFNENREKPVAKRTLQFHLHRNEFKRRVLRKKMVVKEVNRKKRLSWCREKRWWTVQQHWKKVIFSDESKIMIGHDERVYVWRKCGEGWRPDLVPSANVKPKYEAMIWGCITFNGVGTISDVRGNINSEKYQEILENNLWPVLARHFPTGSYLFQDDNAPVHRSRSTMDYIARNHIKSMSWPAQSPDINIIENIWLYLKRKLQCRKSRINSNADLFREVQAIWMDITVDYVQSLYKSIPKRILQVIKLKGHLTKY